MCPSGATCLPLNCCFSEIALQKPTNHVGLLYSGHHHYNIKIIDCFRHDRAETLFTWLYTVIMQSLTTLQLLPYVDISRNHVPLNNLNSG